MDPRTRESVLWGLVGGLFFLVLAFGFRLFDVFDVPLFVLVGVSVPVFIGGTILSHLVGRRLDRKRSI